MHITVRTDDDILKIFAGNRYAGYLDENNTLFCFHPTKGFAMKIASDVEFENAASTFKKWINRPVKPEFKRDRAKELRLLKSLTRFMIKLAPDAPVTKHSLDYLESMER